MRRACHILLLSSAHFFGMLAACMPSMPPLAEQAPPEAAALHQFHLVGQEDTWVLDPATEVAAPLASAWQQLTPTVTARARTFFDKERFASEIEPLSRVEAFYKEGILLLPDDPESAQRISLVQVGGEWMILAEREDLWQPYLLESAVAAENVVSAARVAEPAWQ